MLEALLGISVAYAEEVPEANPIAALLSMIIPFALLFVFMYFFMIRPQRKKDKAVKEMLNNLKTGDRVCTIGGIYGTITGVRDDTFTLTVGHQNMTMVVARWAIRSKEDITVENDSEALN